MAEQLPDGFSQRDSTPGTTPIWDSQGRKLKEVSTISRQERDAFTHTGVEFDGFAQADRLRRASEAITDSIMEEMKAMDPAIRKMIDPITVEDED